MPCRRSWGPTRPRGRSDVRASLCRPAEPRMRQLSDFESRIKRNEPMSRHTSWHVGGPADIFFSPRDRADLLEFLGVLAEGTPLFWLGLGSNLLVRDGG